MSLRGGRAGVDLSDGGHQRSRPYSDESFIDEANQQRPVVHIDGREDFQRPTPVNRSKDLVSGGENGSSSSTGSISPPLDASSMDDGTSSTSDENSNGNESPPLAFESNDSGVGSNAGMSADAKGTQSDASSQAASLVDYGGRSNRRKRNRLSPTSVVSEALGIDSKDRSSPIPEFECGLCLQLLCEPVTIPCGHTFCRNCLVSALERSKKKCPECRAPCHVSAENHPTSYLITSLLQRLYPQLYMDRLGEAESERASWKLKLPLFMMGTVLFPGQPLGLHLFEPRYKLMVKRVLEANRCFGYLPSNPTPGAVGVVSEITECEFLSDGRALITAIGRKRFRILETWIEPGTQDLHYAKFEYVEDDDMPTEAEWPHLHSHPGAWVRPPAFDALFAEANRLVRIYIQLLSFEESRAESGEIPDNPVAFSFWVTSVIPIQNRLKMELLRMTSTVDRLLVLVQQLRLLVRRAGMAESQMQNIQERIRQDFVLGDNNINNNVNGGAGVGAADMNMNGALHGRSFASGGVIVVEGRGAGLDIRHESGVEREEGMDMGVGADDAINVDRMEFDDGAQ
eukprot:Opistho-2@58052